MKYLFLFFGIILALSFTSCMAWKHGYTLNEARDKFLLITGDKNNFGDKRLKYNIGFQKGSILSQFIDCQCRVKTKPSYIYEYKIGRNGFGIKLYYEQLDSVFIFEKPKMFGRATLIESRSRDEHEREVYKSLIIERNAN